jgi:acyl-CoA thioester hydrolase
MSQDLPTAGRFEGRVHHLPVRIYYEDTDFSGVVYHANYLRFFERGRSDYVRAIGVSHQALLEGDNPTAFSVIEINIKFLRAARIDDALLVKTSFNRVSGPRLAIAQSLWRGDEEVARAEVSACCISLTGRAKKPPALLVAALKPFLDPDSPTF